MLNELRQGLEAAQIVLSMATVRHIDPTVINEDTIEAVITLYRTHLHKNLVPALNQTGHLLSENSKDSTASQVNMSPSKKRRRAQSLSASSFAKDMKKIYKLIHTTIQPQLRLMDNIERLVRCVSLDDQQILLISSSSLAPFEVDFVVGQGRDTGGMGQQLQLASINVITAAFRRYPSHRDTMMEDLFPLMLRLPTGKRSLRAFPVTYPSMTMANLNESIHKELASSQQQQPHHIQMISGLLLTLVQACVTRPFFQDVVDSEDDTPKKTIVSGLTHCHQIIEEFVARILKRCRQSKTLSADFRPVLSNIVEDLLICLLIPEYYGAEMILYALVRHILQDLSSVLPSNKAGAKGHFEVTYLNTVFDVLGRIGAVESQILALSRSLSIEAKLEYEETDDDEVKISCHCENTNKQSGLVVGCDRCGVFFHAACVDLDRDSIPEEWQCDECKLASILRREYRNYSQVAPLSLDNEFVLQHYLVSTLHRAGDLQDSAAVRKAAWIDKLHRKGLMDATTMKIVTAMSDKWSEPLCGEKLSDKGSARVFVSLISQSELLLSFRKQMSFILEFMSNLSLPAVRKLSIKTLESIVAGDPELMLVPIVKKAVASRLSDETISVREASVSLIGLFVEKVPRVATSFQTSLLECLSDSGVSVRKRAIRIFQTLLVSNPTYPARSTIHHALIRCAQQPKEEDSVRDLVIHIFEDLWLRDSSKASPSPKPATHGTLYSPVKIVAEQNDTPGLVTPTTPSKESRKKNASFDIVAEQMMELVRVSGSGVSLESLLSKILDPGTSTEKGDAVSDKIHICENIANSLFELLLKIEDSRSAKSATAGKDMVATLKTMAVFAPIVPKAILKYFESLLPYLKADNGLAFDEESAVIGAICEILHSIASVLDQQTVSRLSKSSIAKDLRNISYRFGGATLTMAIQVFCTLANKSRGIGIFPQSLLNMSRIFYEFIYKRKGTWGSSVVDPKTRNNIYRALTILGHVCRFREVAGITEIDDVVLIGIPAPIDIDESNFAAACYNIFSIFLNIEDEETRCVSLHALGELFVSHPKLMLDFDSKGLMAKVLSKNSPRALQLEALASCTNILLAEEKRYEGGKTGAQSKPDRISVSSKISGDQDGEATYFGGVLTSHSDRFFQMSLSKIAEVRVAALRVIEPLLRQGLLNPNEAVPFLYALQGDVEHPDVRNTALQLLITEGEKRPEALRQRVALGVKEAYVLQRRLLLKTGKDVSAVIKDGEGSVQSIFDRVYNECIVTSRKQRHGLSSNLLSMFSFGGLQGDSDLAVDLRLLAFVSQILAHLPYKSYDDPLFIIHSIDNIINLEGAALMEKFAEVLRPVGLANEDEFDDHLVDEDLLEKAAKSKFPSRTQEARALSNSKFDIDLFVSHCQHAASLALLLRLKSFLRTSYNISEIRCMEYDPLAKEKLSDKGLSRFTVESHFEPKIPVTLLMHESPIEKDGLIRQYAEFRALMRHETSADSEDTDMEDESKSLPSRKRAVEEI